MEDRRDVRASPLQRSRSANTKVAGAHRPRHPQGHRHGTHGHCPQVFTLPMERYFVVSRSSTAHT